MGMAIPNKGVDGDILKKIGHPIVDVRTRALHSLMFKLSNQIIQPFELANDKPFLRSLLEWFNNDHWECEALVIQLLERLSCIQPAADHLVAIGAIEFLSELRCHLDVGLHVIIDNILAQLLQLPASSQLENIKCNRNENQITNDNDNESVDDDKRQDPTNSISVNSYPTILSQQDQKKIDSVDGMARTNTRGKFDFSWIQLSEADSLILSTTISRLMSSSSMIKQTCSFIKNTLFADFPACVFLQRPKLLQVVVDHLDTADSNILLHDMTVITSLLDTLLAFTQKLKEATELSNDLLTCDMSDGLTLKNDPNSGTKSDLQYLPHEALLVLMSSQLNTIDFVELVFSSVPKILFLLIDCHLPWLQSSFNEKPDCVQLLPDKLVTIICIGMRLMISLVDLVLSVYERREKSKSKVSLCIHHLSVSLSQLTSKMRRARESLIIPYNFLKLLSPLMFTCGTCFSLLLSNCILKEECLSILSPASVASLKELFADSVLSLMCESHLNQLLPYLQCADKGTAKLYLKEHKVIDSFKNIHMHHHSASSISAELDIVQKCLYGMHVFFGKNEKNIVIATVKKIIECISDENLESGVLSQCQNVLLQLISHVNLSVSNTSYDTLEESLSNSLLNKSLILHKVYTPQFINQLCCFDIHCDDSSAVRVLSWWFRHIHLYTDKDIKRIMMLLPSMLPYIECCASHNSDIFILLLQLFSQSFFDLSERMLSLCRLMFSKSEDVRLKSSECLFAYLFDPSKTLVPQKESVPFHNVRFNVSSANSNVPLLSSKLKVKSASVFKKEDISKLLSVLKSSVDNSLIQSALEQCVVLLQDISLHQIAVEEGLLSFLVKLIHSQKTDANHSKEISVTLLKPAVSCLLMMSLPSSDIRNALCYENNIIPCLLNFIWTCSVETGTSGCVEAKQLIALLIFNKVIKFNSADSSITIRSPLLDWFDFPFKTIFVNNCSTARPISYIDESLYSSVPLRRRLLLHYSLISTGGVDNIPCEISNLGIVIVSDKFDFDADITSQERSASLFDLQSLIYSKLHFWTLPIQNLQKLDHLYNQLMIAHALSVTCLASTQENQQSFSFNIMENFKEIFTPVICERKESVIPCNMIKLLSLCLECCNITDFEWIWKIVTRKKSLCNDLLISLLSNDWNDNQRYYMESLVELYSVLLSSGYTDECPLHILETIHLMLETVVVQSMYDMSLLHNMLEPVVHATAKVKYTKTTELVTLCMKIMNLLVKVLETLMNGRGTMLSSFMGKRAYKSAALSLSQIMSMSTVKDLFGLWLKSFTNPSLPWLQMLLYDRDPEIRHSGFCVLCELCSQPSSCIIAIEFCDDIHTHGLFGLCLDIGLNSSECNLIRQQVLEVLICLLMTCSNHGMMNDMVKCTDEDKNFVTGTCAMSILLSNGGFFQILSNLLKYFVNYLESFTDSINVVENNGSKETNWMLNQSTCNCAEAKKALQLFKEFHLCCNPQVVSSLCQLLYSCLLLVPESVELNSDTIESLTKIISLASLRTVLLLNVKKMLKGAVVSVWIELYSGIVSLLQYCIKMKAQQVNTVEACAKTVMLLTLRRILPKNADYCSVYYHHLCSNVVLLLRTSYVCDKKSQELILSLLVSHWDTFSELLLNWSNSQPSLSFVYVQELFLLMSTVLSHVCDCPRSYENHITNALRDDLQTALNKPTNITFTRSYREGENTLMSSQINKQCPLSNGETESPCFTKSRDDIDYDSRGGSQLCFLLMTTNVLSCGSYSQNERKILNDLSRKLLSLLVSICAAAKQMSLKAGFFESTLEEIMLLQSKITIKSSENASFKTEIDQVIGNILFLQNVMFCSIEHKNILVNLQLVTVLLDIWSLCTVNTLLLRAVLKLLIVYTADCHEAQASLVSQTKWNNNLFNNIIKMASIIFASHKSFIFSNRSSPHTETIVMILQFFSNCVICQECRAVIKRTNFLQTFSSLNIKVNSQSAATIDKLNSILCQWMEVFVNLTAFNDGQKMVSQLPGVIDILCDSSKQYNLKCLKVIRNLCCYFPMKPTLARNGRLIELVVASLKSFDDQLITVAAAAIWSLLYNSVRFRSQLNQSGIQEVLLDVKSSLKMDSDSVLSMNVTGALALFSSYSSKRT